MTPQLDLDVIGCRLCPAYFDGPDRLERSREHRRTEHPLPDGVVGPLAAEARASVALDGETQSEPAQAVAPIRDPVGFPCRGPGCTHSPFLSAAGRASHEQSVHSLYRGQPIDPVKVQDALDRANGGVQGIQEIQEPLQVQDEPPPEKEPGMAEVSVLEACPKSALCSRGVGHSGRCNKPGTRRNSNVRKGRGGGPSVTKRTRPDLSTNGVKEASVLALADGLADRVWDFLTGDITSDAYGQWRMGAALADYREARIADRT